MKTAFWMAAIVLASFGSVASGEEPSLEQRLERLNRKLEQQRVALHIPGMGFGLVMHGEAVLARGFGLANVEQETPATEDDLFAIGSTSKAFTSMLVGMLADEGKMSWDDPVRRHLPEFRLADGGADAKVTLSDLLSHNTGLTRMSVLWYGNDASPEQILGKVPGAEAWKPFRTTFLYNNVMYMAAGQASAAAAEMDWHQLLRQRIFDPLGMERSCSTWAASQAEPRMAVGYNWDPAEQRFEALPLRNLDNIAPAGSINSSAREMTAWLQLLLGGGVFDGERLVNEERLGRMWTETNKAGTKGYGFGWFLDSWQGHRVVEHGGNIDGFSAQVTLLPDDGVGYVLLNNVSASGLQQGSIGLVCEALFGEWKDEVASEEPEALPGSPLPRQEIAPLTGRYSLNAQNMTVSVEINDADRLVLNIPGQQIFVLQWPNSKRAWAFELDPAVKVTFDEPEKSGWINGLSLDQRGAKMRAPRISEAEDLPITIDELMDLRAEKLGTDVWSDIDSIVMTGKVNWIHSGLSADITLMAQGTDRLLIEVDMEAYGSFRTVVDGDTGTHSSVISGLDELDEAKALSALSAHPAILGGDWRDFHEEVVVERMGKLPGKTALVVRLKPFAGDGFTRFLDPEDGRLLREESSANFGVGIGSSGFYDFEDYRDVGGAHLPMRWISKGENLGKLVIQFDRAELNVPIPEGTFRLEAQDSE